MRHAIDAIILIVLFALFAALMHAHTYGSAKARTGQPAQHRAPLGDLDRPGTRFDLFFREPELLR